MAGEPDLATIPREQDAVLALVHLLRALDPSRLVIGNDGWEFVAGDLHGVHDYTQSPEQITERYGTADAAARTVRGGRPRRAARLSRSRSTTPAEKV